MCKVLQYLLALLVCVSTLSVHVFESDPYHIPLNKRTYFFDNFEKV